VLGWDMGAAMALADALRVDRAWAAEILTDIEPAMVAGANERIERARDEAQATVGVNDGRRVVLHGDGV
jgi:hypothetical protein